MVNFADAVGKLSVGKTMIRKPNANKLKLALKNNVTTNNLVGEYNAPKLLQQSGFLTQDLLSMTMPNAGPKIYDLRAGGQYKRKIPTPLLNLLTFMNNISK